MPSSPFSMNFVPPMGQANPQLNDALKRLSAAKCGRPRAVVEKEIFDRLGSADKAKQQRLDSMRKMQASVPAPGQTGAAKPSSSFLDEWLSKRQQLAGTSAPKAATSSTSRISASQHTAMASPAPQTPVSQSVAPPAAEVSSVPVISTPDKTMSSTSDTSSTTESPEKLQLRGDGKNTSGEVAVKLRD